MIGVVENLLLVLTYIVTPTIMAIFAYRLIKYKRIEVKWMVVTFVFISYGCFFYVESKPMMREPIISVAVNESQPMSGKDIVENLMREKFEVYLNEHLFAPNKIFDYKINRIQGPITVNGHDDYYSVSYSVKVINQKWIAGNGTLDGLWVNNKSEYYRLMREGDKYRLHFVGGL